MPKAQIKWTQNQIQKRWLNNIWIFIKISDAIQNYLKENYLKELLKVSMSQNLKYPF